MVRDDDHFEDFNDTYLYSFVNNICVDTIDELIGHEHEDYVVDDTNEWYNI